MKAIHWVLLLAACSSPEKAPTAIPTSPPPVSPHDAARRAKEEVQLRAIVRVDPEPGGKRFQGVWLELADARRFVIAYRAREYWKAFEGHEVVVTGHCYQPAGQAIGGQHFRVDTMRFFKPTRGAGPILEVGPEVRMRGKLAKVAAPANSKAAGSTETRFVEDSGAEHGVFGSDENLDRVRAGDPITIEARAIVPDLSWTAQTGGPQIWIVDRVSDDGDGLPPGVPTDVPEPCPIAP